MKRILITGATGFIGRPLVQAALAHGWTVRAAVRPAAEETLSGIETQTAGAGGGLEVQLVDHIDGSTDWHAHLKNCDAVIHLAGLAHVREGGTAEARARYYRINTEGTLRLAQAAADAGVRRFIFLSTIQVLGERTAGQALREEDPARPTTAYADSKWRAEEQLRQLATEREMQVTIVRPALVYGPGVKANFRRLMQVVARGVPLPLAGVRNVRHLTAMNHLLTLLLTCVDHPSAAGRTFHCADAVGCSTPALLQRIGAAMNRPVRLFPVPRVLLRAAMALPKVGGLLRRLTDSMEVDATLAPRLLAYDPGDPDESLRQAVAAFLHPASSRAA